MPAYEYSVIPAPDRGEKTRGAKTASDRFSVALTAALNEMAAEGWDYLRAETLPSEERSGLTGRTTVYHNVLVFRRELAPVAKDWPFSQPMQASAPVVQRPDAPSGENAPAAEDNPSATKDPA